MVVLRRMLVVVVVRLLLSNDSRYWLWDNDEATGVGDRHTGE